MSTALPVIARILQDGGWMGRTSAAVGIGAAALLTPVVFLLVAAAGSVGWRWGRAALAAGLVGPMLGLVRPLLGRLLGRRSRPDEPLDGDLSALLLVGALLTAPVAHLIGIQVLSGGFLSGAPSRCRDSAWARRRPPTAAELVRPAPCRSPTLAYSRVPPAPPRA